MDGADRMTFGGKREVRTPRPSCSHASSGSHVSTACRGFDLGQPCVCPPGEVANKERKAGDPGGCGSREEHHSISVLGPHTRRRALAQGAVLGPQWRPSHASCPATLDGRAQGLEEQGLDPRHQGHQGE